MEIVGTLEDYVDDYSCAVYSAFPKMFKYLNLHNVYGNYFEQLLGAVEQDIPSDYEYECEIDFLACYNLCLEILSSLDSNYVTKFKQWMNDGTINFIEDEDSFSHTTVSDNHLEINIAKNYTIEDVFGLIHEFFHGMHLEQFDNNLNNEDWYLTTECIAMTGEFYSVFYFLKNNIMTDDTKMYLKKLLMNGYYKADNSLVDGILLEVYDNIGTFDDEEVITFLKQARLPIEYKNIIDSINEEHELNYHEGFTYTIGFPISIMLAKKMIDDSSYINLFNKQFSDIKRYDASTFLSGFGLQDILTDVDFIYDVMVYIDSLSESLFKEDNISLKEYLIEMR